MPQPMMQPMQQQMPFDKAKLNPIADEIFNSLRKHNLTIMEVKQLFAVMDQKILDCKI